MTRQIVLFLACAFCIALSAFLPVQPPKTAAFHALGILTVDSSLIFPHSNTCLGCHGFDVNGHALVTADSQDVNIYDDWSATMMANAAKDPFWRAKVSHELLINPAHSVELQTKCTSCHAPQGHYTAILRGADHYTIDEMLADTIAMDGVSCGACHIQSTEQLGFLHSGNLRFDTNRVVFGPFDIPFSAPMIQYVGFEPIFSEHINDAGICAGCHTLITQTVDLAGNFTGGDFVEQATYHEWLNSDYGADEGQVTCQACHLPRLEEPIVISSDYLFLPGRQPFGQHEMVGANTVMLNLMKNNRDTLGITATEAAYEETIAKTLAMLQERSLETALEFEGTSNDTAYFSLWLTNKAGHKFPSGYPSRRAFVEFWVVDETGDTLFHSGKPDENWEIEGLDEPYEPHYTMINQPGQVQVYETVIADVTGALTTVLERAAHTLKDNRLPPQGFSTGHPAYDTVRIVGQAYADPDFNWKNGLEGSGADRVFYHIPLNGFSGNLDVHVRVHYQSLPPRWMAPILAESTPEIDFFRDLFEASDKSTVIVAEETLENVFVTGGTNTRETSLPAHLIEVFPNPSSGAMQLRADPLLQVTQITLFDVKGRPVWRFSGKTDRIILPGKGVFFLQVKTSSGVWTGKIMGY